VRHRPQSSVPVLVFSILLAAPLGVAGGDWPSFRGNDGTGRAVEVLSPGEGPLALDLRWKRDLGSGYSGIAVAEGLLARFIHQHLRGGDWGG